MNYSDRTQGPLEIVANKMLDLGMGELNILTRLAEEASWLGFLDGRAHSIVDGSPKVDFSDVNDRLCSVFPWWFEQDMEVKEFLQPLFGRSCPVVSNWWLEPDLYHIRYSDVVPGTNIAVTSIFPDEHEIYTGGYGFKRFLSEFGSIYHVTDALSWVRLVCRYPKPEPAHLPPFYAYSPQYTVDWEGFKRDYIGLHISVGGFVTAAYNPLPVRDGWAVLAGWHPGMTIRFDEDDPQ